MPSVYTQYEDSEEERVKSNMIPEKAEEEKVNAVSEQTDP